MKYLYKKLFLSAPFASIIALAPGALSMQGTNLAHQKNINNTNNNSANNFSSTSSNSFDTAYRSAKIGFASLDQQRQHEIKYNEDPNNWQGPIFTDYWGRDYQYPFNAQQVMKDSYASNFTLAFLNPLSNEDETNNLGAGYIDSIQEIHALGGNVTVSFGGWTPNETSFFNQDPSGDVMFQHLRALALGYNVSSFDFDIESVHTFSNQDAIACCQALAKLKSLLAEYHRNLQVRFTESGIDMDTVNTITKYFGTDFIWNDMSWTEHNKPTAVNYNGGFDAKDVEDQLQSNASQLKTNSAFAKMSNTEIYHHLGFTSKTLNYTTDLTNIKAISKWALDHQLGLIAKWKANDDHMVNSPLDPTENAGASEPYDFYNTDNLARYFGNLATYNKPTKAPAVVSGVNVYAKSKQYISLKWNKSPGAQYYILEDGNGKEITQAKRNFAALSFREYPNMTVTGNHTFKVVAANAAGKAVASKPITVNISSDLISGQIEYYDANINYLNYQDPKTHAYKSEVNFIDYQGSIYQDMNTTAKGIPMNNPPSKDKTDWKLLGKATDPRFGLSKQRLVDLANFEWDKNINVTAPLTYVNFKKGSDTATQDPHLNNFDVPVYPNSNITLIKFIF